MKFLFWIICFSVSHIAYAGGMQGGGPSYAYIGPSGGGPSGVAIRTITFLERAPNGDFYRVKQTYGYDPNWLISRTLVPKPQGAAASTTQTEKIEKRQGTITIVNEYAKGPVDYWLNGHKFTIQSGKQHAYKNDQQTTIRFRDEGADSPEIKYSLGEGKFTFFFNTEKRALDLHSDGRSGRSSGVRLHK